MSAYLADLFRYFCRCAKPLLHRHISFIYLCYVQQVTKRDLLLTAKNIYLIGREKVSSLTLYYNQVSEYKRPFRRIDTDYCVCYT